MRAALSCFALLWLSLIPLTASGADKEKDKKDNKKQAPKTNPQPDPSLDRKMDEWESSQRKLFVAQLRARFSAMDTSRDDFLDEAELAVAFRGKDAKPPMSKESGTAATKSSGETSKYPDQEFLLALDDDRDRRISLPEYVEWAEDYALAYARNARNAEETRLRIVDLQLKMAQANSAAQRQAIENQLAQQRAALAKQQADLKDRKDNPNKHRRDKKNKN